MKLYQVLTAQVSRDSESAPDWKLEVTRTDEGVARQDARIFREICRRAAKVEEVQR